MTASHNTRFHRFFPFFGGNFTYIRDHQCYTLYSAQQLEPESLYYSALCTDVLNCILENTREDIKADMASGIVALGLMPTILTFLGSTTAETALLSRRRPMLSFLIACGSPAVNPLPTFVYQDPVAGLKAREGRLLPPFLSELSPWQALCIVTAEYLIILAAMANVITGSYWAGLWTINAFACTHTYLPLLWVVLTIFIHLFGMLALELRVETVKDGVPTRLNGRPSGSMMSWLRAWSRHEFTPCINHDKLELRAKDESYLFVFISWFGSVGTVCHLLYGTVTFSSLAFIG